MDVWTDNAASILSAQLAVCVRVLGEHLAHDCDFFHLAFAPAPGAATCAHRYGDVVRAMVATRQGCLVADMNRAGKLSASVDGVPVVFADARPGGMVRFMVDGRRMVCRLMALVDALHGRLVCAHAHACRPLALSQAA